MSTNTGEAPTRGMTSAVAAKVKDGQNTASPGPTPQAISGQFVVTVKAASVVNIAGVLRSTRSGTPFPFTATLQGVLEEPCLVFDQSPAVLFDDIFNKKDITQQSQFFFLPTVCTFFTSHLATTER